MDTVLKSIKTEYSSFTAWQNEQGLIHREDGPAVEYKTGRKEWWIDGKLHRESGPAKEWADGSVDWYSNGKRHRINGPALTWPKGAEVTWEWWVNDYHVKIY